MDPANHSILAILRQRKLVPAVFPAVVALALVNWGLQPEHPARWLRAILMLPALWLGLGLWYRSTLRSLRRRGVEDESAVVRYFGSALMMSVVAVGLWLIVRLGVQIWVEVAGSGSDLDTARRVVGLAGSAVLIVIGNALPKILTPLAMLPRGQAGLVTVARRFVGMTMVILGLASALAFASAPLEAARTVLLVAWILATATTLGAIVWMNLAAASQER